MRQNNITSIVDDLNAMHVLNKIIHNFPIFVGQAYTLNSTALKILLVRS